MGWLVRLALLLLVAGGGANSLHAQNWGIYQWQVTHTTGLAAALTGVEADRAVLESNIAVQEAFQSWVLQQAVGHESYHALRAYSKFLRVLRMFRQVKHAYKNLNFTGREWALLPQLKMTAPTEVGKDPETGEPLFGEREMFSLSFVPPELQTSWSLSDYPDDDFLLRNNGGGKPFIVFDYPHKLSDIQLTFSPSPFLSDSADAESGMQDLMGHSYEALMVAAARLAGLGVRVNPTLLKDGSYLLQGRATPQQLKLQAAIYEGQALQLLDKILLLYVDHGMSLHNAQVRLRSDMEFWRGFSDRVMTSQAARAAYAMNLMTEVNQTLARLESLERRNKNAETDEAFQHAGEKKGADGMWQPISSPEDFWDKVDTALGNKPWGEALKLQLMGLQARYAHSTFEEVQGLRNILVALHRANAATEATQQISTAASKIGADGLIVDDNTTDKMRGLLGTRKSLMANLAGMGWGGTP